jgi:hypothetical protein
LIAAGTSLTTEASELLEPEAAAEVLELAAAELVPDDDELLLLPHPATATMLSSRIATESQLFRVRIALLLEIEVLRRICNNAFTGAKF